MEVIVLAGGLGTRLRSAVPDQPKCMADIDGRPFLWYLFRFLARYDVSRVVLALGYLSEKVTEWASARSWPFELAYSIEDEPLGTGGALLKALSQCRDESVVVINGDTLADVDLDMLMAYHRQNGAAITLTLKRMYSFDRYGTVLVDEDGVVRSFEEKRPCDEGLINAGVQVLSPASVIWPSQTDMAVKFSFERELLEPMASGGSVQSVETDGYFIDIGVPEDYRRAQIDLPRLFPESLEDVAVSGYGVVLLDRDGVINELRRGDYVRRWRDFRFKPGVMEALARWEAYGLRVFVVTNQRGVGRGLMTRQTLDDIHSRMCAEIENYGGHIEGVYVCTAVSDDDPCRKPNTGMFSQLLSDHPDISPEDCLMIGDSASDMLFAARCGIAGVRL